MQEAYPHGYGMGVVVGLDERTVSRLADESGTRKAPVHTANVNAPLQISVAGTDDALERFLNLARENGARRAADAFPDARCVAVDESGVESALLLIGRARERVR